MRASASSFLLTFHKPCGFCFFFKFQVANGLKCDFFAEGEIVVLCGGLIENDPQRLIYLNASTTVGGLFGGRLGDFALLQEVCHWG